MRTTLLLLVSAITLMAPLTATAETRATAGPLDQHYLMNGIEGDHFEIQGGSIALDRGSCPVVMRLAKRLKKDHSMSLSDSTKLAHQLSVEVPKKPTPSMQWELSQTRTLSGASFDRAYATLELKDHVEDIANTTEEIAKGQTAEVRASARKELPMLRAHLALSKAAVKAC